VAEPGHLPRRQPVLDLAPPHHRQRGPRPLPQLLRRLEPAAGDDADAVETVAPTTFGLAFDLERAIAGLPTAPARCSCCMTSRATPMTRSRSWRAWRWAPRRRSSAGLAACFERRCHHEMRRNLCVARRLHRRHAGGGCLGRDRRPPRGLPGLCGRARNAAPAARSRRGLPREIEPSRDLWPEVAGRLGAQQNVVRGWFGGRWQRPLAAAAAVVVAVGTADRLLRGTSARKPPGGAGPNGVATGGSGRPRHHHFAGAETEFSQARDALLAALEARRGSMSQDTLRVVDENLQLIDQAIERISIALVDDPLNPRWRISSPPPTGDRSNSCSGPPVARRGIGRMS